MTVAVTMWYVPGCAECIADVENTVRAAIRDWTVTKVTLGAGHKHSHPTEADQPRKLSKPTSQAAAAQPPMTPIPPSGELFTVESGGQSAASPNGFD